jgi:RND family efflux transporter MFP subunit
VVIAGAAVIILKKRSLAHLPSPGNPPIPVATATVKPGAVGSTVETVALIQARTAATVSAQVSGALLEVRFREGDAVRNGEVMARIDPSVLEDAVQAAQARFAAADEDLAKQQAIHDRDRILYDNQAISRQSLDISAAQLAAANAAKVTAERALASARVVRAYADVPAPYSGVVTARLVEPGDLVAPGKPLYALQVPGAVKLVSKLSQETLRQLKRGDAVTFTAAGRTLAGRIARVYPALDATHLGTVETELPEAPFDLPPGATVSARYTAAPTPGLVVPVSALLQGLGETLVIRVKQARTEPVPVTVTSESGTEATVRGALAPGDVVVTGLPSELMALTAGTPVALRGR